MKSVVNINPLLKMLNNGLMLTTDYYELGKMNFTSFIPGDLKPSFHHLKVQLKNKLGVKSSNDTFVSNNSPSITSYSLYQTLLRL